MYNLNKVFVKIGNFSIITYGVLVSLVYINSLFISLYNLPVAPYLALELLQIFFLIFNGKPKSESSSFMESAFPYIVSFFMVAATIFYNPTHLAVHISPSLLFILRLVPFTVAVLGFVSLRRNFSVATEVRGLVTTGIYKYIRHPIYSAYLMLWWLQALLLGSLLYTSLVMVATMLIWIRSRVEDGKLESVYPDRALTNDTTGAFFPTQWLKGRSGLRPDE